MFSKYILFLKEVQNLTKINGECYLWLLKRRKYYESVRKKLNWENIQRFDYLLIVTLLKCCKYRWYCTYYHLFLSRWRNQGTMMLIFKQCLPNSVLTNLKGSTVTDPKQSKGFVSTLIVMRCLSYVIVSTVNNVKVNLIFHAKMFLFKDSPLNSNRELADKRDSWWISVKLRINSSFNFKKLDNLWQRDTNLEVWRTTISKLSRKSIKIRNINFLREKMQDYFGIDWKIRPTLLTASWVLFLTLTGKH